MSTPSVTRVNLINAIEIVATTYVGELMGKAASTAHLRRLKIEDNYLGCDQVDAVLNSLRSGLKVLVGDRTAEKAIREIRKRVDA